MDKIKILVTIGPSLRTEADLAILKDKGVDFIRLNMSHSTTDDLRNAIALAKRVGIAFIIDTEGSQVRTGSLQGNTLEFQVGDSVPIYVNKNLGSELSLSPPTCIHELTPGDLLYCDFDSLVLCVSDCSSLAGSGYITARVVFGGTVGSNKAIYVDRFTERPLHLPVLTEKDKESIQIGLSEGIDYIAASFMRSRESVEEVRLATQGKMKIISKIECIDGLKNLDEIIDASDFLLVDRGDLSKEILVQRVPLTQKIIVHRANQRNKQVFVATNFLESMVTSRRPTRAEVHDIESSITDGAAGLTLAAETAIGKHPFDCLNVMQSVIRHITSSLDVPIYRYKEAQLIAYLESKNYLLDFENYSSLIPPHGGKLVDRLLKQPPANELLATLPHLKVSNEAQMDCEQIALGGYSPLEGFMNEADLTSVLDTMRLKNGILWPMPIILDVDAEAAMSLAPGDTVVLVNKAPFAFLHIEEKYTFDRQKIACKLYGTSQENHPGVRRVLSLKPCFLAGKIDLFQRMEMGTSYLQLSPRQVRRLFEEKCWNRIVGFHTRNAIHRGHECIQMAALERSFADGLFVHPVIGAKKPGDFHSAYIIKSYDIMIQKFYPPNKVLLAALATYPRYAGPKEALFTALIRQNYGCSHFVVGRDHTGVSDFYPPSASQDIFKECSDLLIQPLFFNEVFYSTTLKRHIHKENNSEILQADEKYILSGTFIRETLKRGELPPEWCMRGEISHMILKAIREEKTVFE